MDRSKKEMKMAKDARTGRWESRWSVDMDVVVMMEE